MVWKLTLLLGVLFVSYTLILLNLTVLVTFLAWICLGVSSALVAINLCHDAIHGALSRNHYVNRFGAIMFNLLGANEDIWRITHNQMHHGYTNIHAHDSDIDLGYFLCLTDDQPWKWYHRYQHLYAFLLYPLSSLQWVTIKDFVLYYKKLRRYEAVSLKGLNIPKLIAYKLLSITIFLVIPLVFLPWWLAAAGFVLMHLVEGLTLALIFNPGHLVEHVEFPKPDDQDQLPFDWVESQMRSTCNFGIKNKATNFICGGLNFQVEHHLFPGICHIHYPRIAPIVHQTAKEFNLPYHEFSTYSNALNSYYRFLKKMGSPRKTLAPVSSTLS